LWSEITVDEIDDMEDASKIDISFSIREGTFKDYFFAKELIGFTDDLYPEFVSGIREV